MTESEELRALRAECARLREENARLRKLVGHEDEVREAAHDLLPSRSIATTLTPDEKVDLFYDLFRGRRDVFALGWVGRDGRPGYSPAHCHESDSSLCRRPRAVCETLGPRRFLRLTHEVVRDHLTGRSVVGIYPLLSDDTCNLLALDFDKAGWSDAARRFAALCRQHELPAYVERSRSGNGGHVWLFFERAIPAAMARRLGLGLLSLSSIGRFPLSFASFDRLFPNQDTVPKGGFGNLVALPLQRKARDAGNSVFLGDSGEPEPDQWSLLSGIRRIPVDRVEAAAERLVSPLNHLFIPDDYTADDPEAMTLPWERLPSGAPSVRPEAVTGCPPTIQAVRSNLFYVAKSSMPGAVLNHLLSLAAFGNPEFYRAQKMRLPVRGKPRVISCGEDLSSYIGLPRGLEPDAVELLRSYSIATDVDDERTEGSPIAATFTGTLNHRQQAAMGKLLEHDIGVLCAPTAFGKTVVAIALLAQRARSTLILVHRRQIADQWLRRIKEFLDTDDDAVSLAGPNASRASGTIDIALFQSVFRKGAVHDTVAEYGHVIVDECHHVSAFSFEQTLKQARARYILGLTATPVRQDGRHPIISMQCGPIRVRVGEREQTRLHDFSHRVIVRDTALEIADSESKAIHEVYDCLTADERRIEMIANDVVDCCAEGRLPLVLSERKDHLSRIEQSLKDRVSDCVVLTGGMGKKRTRHAMERLEAVGEGRSVVILATGRYIGEGFDHARLDTLFLAFPVSWRGVVRQYAGRLHRNHRDKQEVRIYDYADLRVPVLAASFRRRMKSYRAMGYELSDDHARGSRGTRG